MYFVFYRTTDVFEAEERLIANEIKEEITPTPVQDKAYCGVCLQVNESDCECTKALLSDLNYQIIP